MVRDARSRALLTMRFAIPLDLILRSAAKAARLEGWATGESGADRPWFETRGFAALLTMR